MVWVSSEREEEAVIAGAGASVLEKNAPSNSATLAELKLDNPTSGQADQRREIAEQPHQQAAKPGSQGLWSTMQSIALGPQPSLRTLKTKCEVLSSRDSEGGWRGAREVVTALNEGILEVEQGVCVVYSSEDDGYWLLWRSDKDQESKIIAASEETASNLVALRTPGEAMPPQDQASQPLLPQEVVEERVERSMSAPEPAPEPQESGLHRDFERHASLIEENRISQDALERHISSLLSEVA
jgi:hypothetical protein